MPIDELALHEKIYPVALSELVGKSTTEGWADTPPVTSEEPK
jgi:hypothetical protein